MSPLSFALDGSRVLTVAPDLESRVRGATLELVSGGRTFSFDSGILPLIAAFTPACTLPQALELLRPRLKSRADWIAATSTIHELVAAGVLRARDDASTGWEPVARSFGSAAAHAALLNDQGRTRAFVEAIQATVRPTDVVLDIGTGSGVLAIAAAKAGAKKVYAVEGTGIADAAEAMIRANGLERTIELIRGWSTQITLPERATLLVSELIGSEPLCERILETTLDATERLLAPGARYLPSHLSIECALVELPADVSDKHFFTSSNAARWTDAYGIDFSALSALRAASSEAFRVDPNVARQWRALDAAPYTLCTLDLAKLSSFSVDAQCVATPCRAGVFDAVLVSFVAKLTESVEYSTASHRVPADCHWKSTVHRLPSPLRVDAGGRVQISYRYRSPGEPVSVEVLHS